jgi:PAS domain S-box-containing protein
MGSDFVRSTVLVIENNPVIRRLVRLTLEREGLVVLEAPDGRTAERLVARQVPALILLDLVLPETDGFQLVASLRAREALTEVPILALSGMISKLDEARIPAAGFDDVISKPVEPSRLVQIVRSYLSGTGPQRVPFGHGRSLVVADDDPIQLKLACVHLRRMGFLVVPAADGHEALERARQAAPAAIVADVMMPGLDGFALCMAARADPTLASVPILLFTSSYVETADRELAQRAGATDFVVRTPDLACVFESLHRNLGAPAPSPGPSLPLEALRREHGKRLVLQLERQVALNSGVVRRCSTLHAELAVLSGISEALVQTGDVETALDEVISACLDAGGISVGVLYLLAPDGKLRVRGFGDVDGWTRPQLETFFGQPGLLRSIIEGGATKLIPAAEEPEEQAQQFLISAGLAYARVVPLVHAGERLGALVEASRLARRDDDDERDSASFVEAVANQIGQALALARAFTARSEAENRYQTLVEHSAAGVIVSGLDGEIREVNTKAEALLGWPKSKLLGAQIMNLIEREDHEEVERRPLELKPGGQDLKLEARVARADGRVIVVEMSLAVVKLQSESVVLSVLSDVTERVRAEEERKRLIRQLEAAIRQRDDVLTIAAHELRTPLTPVRLQAQVLIRAAEQGPAEPLQPPQLIKRLAIIDRGVDRLQRLITSLLDVSCTSAKGMLLQRQHFDLATAVREVLGRLSDECRRAGCSVTLEAPAAIVGDWDRSRIEQVVENLVGNSLKYGAGKPIEVRVAGDAERARLSVRDHGMGIAPQDQDRIFDRFERLLPLKHYGGFGLGLWIARQIVFEHLGEIKVTSAQGEGALFTVELPRHSPGLEVRA